MGCTYHTLVLDSRLINQLNDWNILNGLIPIWNRAKRWNYWNRWNWLRLCRAAFSPTQHHSREQFQHFENSRDAEILCDLDLLNMKL